MDYNSNVNQEIKQKFVGQYVYTCFSCEMQDCLEKEVVSYDDIENISVLTCPHCSEEFSDEDYDELEECPSCKENYPDEEFIFGLEYQPQEIMEWWIVSRFLYEKLQAKGYPVLEWGNNYYWGRCTSGQAILLDRVISEICSDMEILEGQKYSWAVTK